MSSHPTAAQFPSAPMIILFNDLAGYARGFLSHTDSDMAAFTHRYYRMAGEVIKEQGGKVIKFMGDGVLSIFPPYTAFGKSPTQNAQRWQRPDSLTKSRLSFCNYELSPLHPEAPTPSRRRSAAKPWSEASAE